MPKWTDYTKKTSPENNDEVMILDTAGKANKRLNLSVLSDWILNKIADKVFQKLETNSKTVLGAINELNRNPFLRYERAYGTSLTVSNVRGASHGLILITYTLIPFYISGSSSLGYTIAVPQLPSEVSVSNDGYAITITTKTAQVITCIYPYMK